MKNFIIMLLALASLAAACHWHAKALEPLTIAKPTKVRKDEGSEHHMEPVRITVPVTRVQFNTPEVVTARRPRLTLVDCTEYVCSYEYR